MKLKLRDYQRAALDAIYGYFSRGERGNPLVLAPTGSGKSVIIAGFCCEVMTQWPGQRILILTHVKELVQQNLQRLLTAWPSAPVGVYSAGLNRRDTWQPIIFASIQSVYSRAQALGHFDLILIDECHLIPATGEGMYRRFLSDAQAINPLIRVIGFTATPYRMKSGHLIGPNTLFTDVAYDACDIRYLVDSGYLCPVVARDTVEHVDMSDARLRGGEYMAADMQAAAESGGLVAKAVTEIIRQGASRRSWLIFCAGVDHAYHVRDELAARGIAAGTVVGSTPAPECARILRQYQTGEIRALTNCDVLTTGFDAPFTDLIALLRPTKSKGLYVQMVGRGMRVAEGKDNCLVLDFAGVVAEHGPIDQVTMSAKAPKDEPGEAPTKTCPECSTILPAGAHVCTECSHEFELQEGARHDDTPSDRELLSWQEQAEEYAINRIIVQRWEKPGKPDSVKVMYWEGISLVASQWICPEHTGYARMQFERWWMIWVDSSDIPATVGDAIDFIGHEGADVSAKIAVKRSGKYPEVVGYDVATKIEEIPF